MGHSVLKYFFISLFTQAWPHLFSSQMGHPLLKLFPLGETFQLKLHVALYQPPYSSYFSPPKIDHFFTLFLTIF